MPPIEQRIDKLQRQIHVIQRHLGLLVDNMPIGGARSDSKVDPDVPVGRIDAIESQSRQLGQRLQQIQSQVDALQPKPRPLVPVADGRFVIFNRTGVSQYVSVNGLRFYAAPGRTEMKIPRTIVEAYLPGFECPKLLGMSNWRWTGRQYEMWMDIRI